MEGTVKTALDGRTVGEVAEELDLTPRTLKYYEELGLVSPSRTGGNYRLYSQEDIERLHRIRRMKALGLSLAAIQEALKYESELDRDGTRVLPARALRSVLSSLEESRAMLVAKVVSLRGDIRNAEDMIRSLDSDIEYLHRRLAGESSEVILRDRQDRGEIDGER